jgi:DNA-binding protein H-NS
LEIVMKHVYLKSLTTDGLWSLHESITAKLAEKLVAEKTMLEDRLRLLSNGYMAQAVEAPRRRPYPRVLPKFRNPEAPTETWAGRGKQPRWLKKQLRSGKRIDDFRIRPSALG